MLPDSGWMSRHKLTINERVSKKVALPSFDGALVDISIFRLFS